MNILELSNKAQSFYEKTRSKTLFSGYEKNVLVRCDFDNCLFVKAEYEPQPGDVLFRCRTINQNTVIDLKVAVPETETIEQYALKGKLTQAEWMSLLDSMNGIIISKDIDLREQLAGGVSENVELAEKLKNLSELEARILAAEVEVFWGGNKNISSFLSKYL